MPLKIFKATIIGGEILRIGRASSSTKAFVKSARSIIERMKQQGAHDKELTKIKNKIFGRHDELKKFAVNSVKFVTALL